jgi:hypothetical protein
MSPHQSVPIAARERLRDHQAVATKAVAVHSAAATRFDAVLLRRTKLISEQDLLVAAANAEVATAIAAIVQAVGVEIAADVLGLTKLEIRDFTKAVD